jgi:hypothetical protein
VICGNDNFSLDKLITYLLWFLSKLFLSKSSFGLNLLLGILFRFDRLVCLSEHCWMSIIFSVRNSFSTLITIHEIMSVIRSIWSDEVFDLRLVLIKSISYCNCFNLLSEYCKRISQSLNKYVAKV